MNNGNITADTLAKLLNEVDKANKKSPGLGAFLFKGFAQQVTLLRSSALDEAAD